MARAATRLAVFCDFSYRRDGELITAELPFSLFLDALARHFGAITLVGRLDPTGTRFPYEMRDIELAPLPYYASGADLSAVMRALPAAVRPSPNLLNFVMLADPNNPMGGILTRFIPGFGEFRFATPFNTPYTTALYTLQYDAISNFPMHPLWLPSDINAVFGAFDSHVTVPYLSAAQVATAIQEHIGNLTYYFIPSTNLPLLDPLRMIPILGDPLADVLQPFLRPIVDLGYGSPFAIPGIIPSLSPFTFAGSLGQGAALGITSPLVGGLPSVGLPIVSGF